MKPPQAFVRFFLLPFTIIIVLAVITPRLGYCRSVGNEFIPPEHWTYPALKRFETLRLVQLPSEQLFTRPDVIGYVETIVASIERRETDLSARDRFDLDRLKQEYSSVGAKTTPRSRFDPPLIYAIESPLSLEFDAALSFVPVKPSLDPRWAFFATANPSMRLHFGESLTCDVRYRLAYGPERDKRVDKKKPTRRTKSWRGLTALYERAYLVYDWKRRVTLFWGRDYANWGPGEFGNLMFSNSAGSLDKFGARILFKSLRLSFMNGTLSTAADRRFAAHRLEMRFGRAVVGLSEGVVYVGRGFDPIYLLPLSSFYGNQYNAQGGDNVLWGFDVKAEITRGLLLYGNFLIDDLQFEANQGFPQKFGFDLGGRIALVDPFPATFRFQYRYVDIYTYTHEDSATYWFGGEVDPALDSPLGDPLGPDSDKAFADMAVYPVPSLTALFSISYQRVGEGNDYRMFQEGDVTNPSFPSGVVEKTLGLGVGLEWELPRNSSIGGNVVYAHVKNVNHQAGTDEWTPSVTIHLTWNL